MTYSGFWNSVLADEISLPDGCVMSASSNMVSIQERIIPYLYLEWQDILSEK